MKKLFLVVTVLSLLTSCAKNKSAPDYLLNNKFPRTIQKVEIQSIEGQMLTFGEVLDKHKGKKVVLDFWASWCGDCLSGLPSFQKLQKETTNVDYVLFSLDRSESRWKNAVNKLKIEGDHYFVTNGFESEIADYVDLSWIPRYMILDETGKIIVAKEVNANNDDFRKVLLKK